MPKFASSAYSDAELPEVVRDVCRHVDPLRPEEVSQPRFDAARSVAGHPDAPSAKRISARLRRPWPEVKRDALDSKREDDRGTGTRGGREDQPWLGEQFCIFALRLIADHLPNSRNDPSPAEYDEIADRLAARDAKRFRHGGRLILPTSLQVTFRFGTWGKALAAADLDARRQPKAAGVQVGAEIELALEMTGCLLTHPDLQLFFRAKEVSLQNVRRTGMTYPEHVARVRERRAAEGKWTPWGYAPKELRQQLLEGSGAIQGPRARKRRWTVSEIEHAMDKFTRDRRGKSQTRRDYVAWARGRSDAPVASVFGRNGNPSFKAARDAARRRLRGMGG